MAFVQRLLFEVSPKSPRWTGASGAQPDSHSGLTVSLCSGVG